MFAEGEIKEDIMFNSEARVNFNPVPEPSYEAMRSTTLESIERRQERVKIKSMIYECMEKGLEIPGEWVKTYNSQCKVDGR